MILESLISLSCAGFNGDSHDACTKALEATSKQVGIDKNVSSVENRVSKSADQQARELVGNSGMNAGAVLVGAGKAISDKSATFKFPVFMPQMFFNLQIGTNKSLAGVEWKF